MLKLRISGLQFDIAAHAIVRRRVAANQVGRASGPVVVGSTIGRSDDRMLRRQDDQAIGRSGGATGLETRPTNTHCEPADPSLLMRGVLCYPAVLHHEEHLFRDSDVAR